MKPFLSGNIHLLPASGDNFWNGLSTNASNRKAWIDGYRGRTSIGKLMPNGIYGAIDWSGPDSAINVCRQNGKKLGLSISMGLTMPTDFYTSEPTVGNLTVQVDGSGGTGTIPLIWEPAYLNKIAPFIKAFGAKYDKEPIVAAVFFTGYQQIVECHVVNTPTDNTNYNAAAVAAGFTGKTAAWLPNVKRIIDLFMRAFPTTSVMFTAGNPWSGDDGATIENDIQDYVTTTYPGHGGLCSSFLHAKLTHTGTPSLQTYPVGDQAISASTDDSRFYSPAMPGTQPPDPTPVLDLLENGYDQGDQYVEVYNTDVGNTVNDATLIAERLRLISNVPAAGLPHSKAKITTKDLT